MTNIIDTNVTCVALLDWVGAATKIFEDFGFVRANGGWWKHEDFGTYAVLDDAEMGFGRRYAGIYAHRIDSAGTEFMTGLALVPWYGDGADIETARCLLKNAISNINRSGR